MESEAELAFCSGIFRFSGPFPIGEIRCHAIIAAEKMLSPLSCSVDIRFVSAAPF